MGAPLLTPTQAEQDFAALSAGLAPEARAAYARFAAAGLPNRKVEAWHYTDLRAKLRAAPPLAPAPDATTFDALRARIPASDTLKLVLVDGRYVPELSDDVCGVPGLSVGALRESVSAHPDAAAQDPLLDLNAAFANESLFVTVAPGEKIDEVIEIVALCGVDPARSRFSRCSLALGEGASAKIIETRAEGGEGFSDSLTVLLLGAGARLDYACRCENSAPVEVQNLIVSLDADSQLRAAALVAGAPFLRRQVFVSCAGEGARVDLTGASLLKGREHADTTLVLQHDAPGCTSRETFKYVLGGEANGVFQGKIIVPPHAQKTDGKMLCRALVLSDAAAMSAKPELEIFADDVACGHGAAVAKLDAAQLFYMESRGLPRPEAQSLLIAAFAAEVFDDLDEAMRDLLLADLARLLAAGDFA